jgi:ribosomal-protein-alanine N-acetyltransferase
MSAVFSIELRVVPMRVDELDEIIAIERQVYEFPWTPGNFRDSMRAGYECRTLRAGDNNELIGYGVLMRGVGEAHLLNISIAPAHQRRGYGARLLEYFVQLAQRERFEALYLEVRPSNDPARRLYARRGFTQIGRRRDYYPAKSGREDALVLALSL